MQQEGLFSKHDYVLRFYVIMAVRALILGKLDVPELSSGAMEKENKKMIEMLKTDVTVIFLMLRRLS